MKTNFTITKWLALVGILVSSSANAVTVYFDDANRGPSSLLQIGDVTVSGQGLSTALGYGLGADNGSGSAYGFNEVIQTYNWGDSPSGESGMAGISVPGIIDAITIVPFAQVFTESGVLLPDQPSFEMSCDLDPGSPWRFVAPGAPVTFNRLPDSGQWQGSATAYVSLQNDYPPEFWLSLPVGEYVDFGFSVLSLDYTPTPAPEPCAVRLVGLGLCGWLVSKLKLFRGHPKT
jgi:hypothetical protein